MRLVNRRKPMEIHRIKKSLSLQGTITAHDFGTFHVRLFSGETVAVTRVMHTGRERFQAHLMDGDDIVLTARSAPSPGIAVGHLKERMRREGDT